MLLRAIVEAYSDDSRVLAIGVFGSVGRGTWDEWSDLDLDVIIADDLALEAVSEARRLCRQLGMEDALIVSARTDEADVVLPSLEQFSIRYHPLGTINAHIVEDLKIVAGRLDHSAIVAGGMVQSLPARSLERITSEALRFALSTDTALRRGNIWQALRSLEALCWRLQELFAVSHGLQRPAHAVDSHASADVRHALAGVVAQAESTSITRALGNALGLIASDTLTGGRYVLTRPQQAVLAAVQQRISDVC
jgi:predicted nucleotidyltransferase